MQRSHGQCSMGKLKHGRMQCARMGEKRELERCWRGWPQPSPQRKFWERTLITIRQREHNSSNNSKKKTKNKTNKPKPKNLCFLEK